MRQRVFFDVDGVPVVADLYRPAGPGPFPAVVVSGPMTSVKEQVSGVYAAALAVRGIAALCLDHRHYGESGGLPRQYENPDTKIADLRAAVRELAGRECVDGARVGLVGVCLGGGYGAAAAADLPAVRAFASVAGYFPDPAAMRAGDPEGFAAEVATGAAARADYERTGVAAVVPAAGGAGSPMTHHDIVEYYATPRAGVANYRNAFAVMSREPWLLFDGQEAAPRLRVPALAVHAHAALAPSWAQAFHARLPQPVEPVWLPAPSQASFYDDPALVNDAADRVAAFLHEHL